MAKEDFHILFAGEASQFSAFSRFFDRLAAAKNAFLESPDPSKMEAAIVDPSWVDLLDSEALDRATSDSEWQLEDILDCILNGEYRLVGLEFDGHAGRLIYDPWAYPFGGTDPLKALIRMFGFEVIGDSFWDGLEAR